MKRSTLRLAPASYFFDLLIDREIDVLTGVFDRVLANLDRGGDGDRPRDTSSRQRTRP
jgi:hypothetical protein